MEDYEKKYKEALEKFEAILNLDNVKESGTIDVEDVRKILTELQESPEEKIRKHMLSVFRQYRYSHTKINPGEWEGLKIDDIISWLENRSGNGIDEASYQAGVKRVLENPASYGLVEAKTDETEWTKEDRKIVNALMKCLDEVEQTNGWNSIDSVWISEVRSWLLRLEQRMP